MVDLQYVVHSGTKYHTARCLQRTNAPNRRCSFKSLIAGLTCWPCKSIVIIFSMFLFLQWKLSLTGTSNSNRAMR